MHVKLLAMKAPDSISVQIETEAQAHVLMDPLNQKMLDVLLSGPCSAQTLVEQTRLPMHRVHYRLKVLVRHGFVCIDDLQKRAGRPIKIYRVTAQSWSIPFHLTRSTDLADFLETSSEQWMKHVFKPMGDQTGNVQKVVFARHGPGPAYLDPIMTPEGQQVMDQVMVYMKDFRLDPARLPELKAALDQVFSEFHTEEGKAYSTAVMPLYF